MSREMKDTPISGLTQIPKTWNVVPLKMLFSFSKGLSITKSDLTDEGIKVISYGQIHSKNCDGVHATNELVRFTSDKFKSNNSLVKCGGFIFADTSEDLNGCGNAIYITDEVYGGYHTVVLNPKEAHDYRYLAYLFKTDAWRTELRKQLTEVKVFSITQFALKNMHVILPSNEEMTQIADFLDSKCSSIDQTIQKQKDIVNKLIEYKKSIIIQAVTKGLNPNVEIKDTPISGLTQIPKTWNVVPLKMLFSFSKGLSITKSDLTDEGIKVISYGQIHSKNCDGVHATNELVRFTSDKFKSNNSLVKCGGFIFADTSEDLNGCGNAIYITDEVYGGYHTVVLNPKEAHDYRYLAYLFKTDAWRTELRKQLTEVKVFSITQFALKNMHVILPSNEEMTQIADFLDSKCSKINESVERSNKIIKKLEEYKKSLIYNAVTGKIDCRGEAK